MQKATDLHIKIQAYSPRDGDDGFLLPVLLTP